MATEFSDKLEKSAMDPTTKKYLASGLAAALLSAGVGTTVSRLASAKKRRKALDMSKNRNVITVDIDIPNFVKDLPTPAQFAATKQPAGGAAKEMSADDIEAVRKAIVRQNSRKLDFFGKAAAEDMKPAKTEGDDAGKDGAEKKNSDGTVRLRDSSGRFTSPTSPVAIKEVEKDAGVGDTIAGWLKSITKPVVDPMVEFGGAVRDGLVESPKLVAGGVASVALAALIAKHINKQRASSAKSKLESQRDAYIEQLNGTQKKAADNIGESVGLAAGASFLAPFALTSMIAYKIMANRAEQQDKARKNNGSFPTQPVILYRTRGGVEKEARVKSPAEVFNQAKDAVVGAVQNGVGKLVDATGIGVDSGVDRTIEMFGRADNKKHLADIAKSILSGKQVDAGNLFKMMGPGDYIYAPVMASNSFKQKLLSNKKFQDMIIGMLDDKSLADSFGQIRDNAVRREVGKLVGNNNQMNQLLSNIVISSGTWKPGVRQRMDRMASRYGI